MLSETEIDSIVSAKAMIDVLEAKAQMITDKARDDIANLRTQIAAIETERDSALSKIQDEINKQKLTITPIAEKLSLTC